MWDFMKAYADSFWIAGDYAWDVFGVIMAWAITIGFAGFMTTLLHTIGMIIAESIKDQHNKKK